MALSLMVPGAVGNAFIDGDVYSGITVVGRDSYFFEFKDANDDHVVVSVKFLQSFVKTGNVTPPTPQWGVGVTLTDYWSETTSFDVLNIDSAGSFFEVDLGGGDIRTWSYVSLYKIV
jgi:hypothetical protein